MSTTEVQTASPASSVGKVVMKLENQVIPVSDVDRSKQFYESLGWRLDDDVAPMVAAKAGQPAVNHAAVAGFQRGHHAFPLNQHCREYEVLNEQAGDGGPERHAQENVTMPGLGFDGSLSQPDTC